MLKKNITDFRGEMPYTPNEHFFKIKDEPISPTEEDFDHQLNYSFEGNNGQMRKSMSMSDIATIREDLITLKFSDNKEDVFKRHRKQSCAPDLSKNKFVSMAEAIYHYQRDTPDRFHTSRPKSFIGQAHMGRSALTRPQSPMLRCKARARPQHVLSQKEKEELEIEEIRKFKIKANPVPKSIIEGSSCLPEVPRKPNTIIEPFKLTEVHKKIPQSPEHIVNFKARPAPKHILEKPNNIPSKAPVSVTKAVTPKFHCKGAKSINYVKNDLTKRNKTPDKSEKVVKHQGPIKPEPFSFEKRDEEMKRKREERIKAELENERKLASQFKAQPMPAAIIKKTSTNSIKSATSTASLENKENNTKFEAKPPIVLYKKPFKPILQPLQIIQTMPFDLTTEKRAAERELFDRHLKEKEEEKEKLYQQKQREQQELEEKAVAELRSKLVHHAKPVPPLLPKLPEKITLPVTCPQTPQLVRRLKKH